MVGGMLVFAEPEFVVQSVGERPVVLGAHPTSVRQGAQAKIFIDMSAPADADEAPHHRGYRRRHHHPESVERRGSGLDVQVSVAHDAPLGDHPIEVDEGDRLLEGASLEVKAHKVPEQKLFKYNQKHNPVVGTLAEYLGHHLAQASAAEQTEKSPLIPTCAMPSIELHIPATVPSQNPQRSHR